MRLDPFEFRAAFERVFVYNGLTRACLDPFEFRAAFEPETKASVTSKDDCLDPFEFRAAFEPVAAVAVASGLVVSIPLNSGLHSN